MNLISDIASTFAGNVASDTYGKAVNQKLEAGDGQSTLVVADENTVRRVIPHRHLPLEDSCVVPLFLHFDRGTSTRPIITNLNKQITGINSIRLVGAVIDNYSATPSYVIRFLGTYGFPEGMSSYGSECIDSNSIMVPTTSLFQGLEIARWKNGDGKINDAMIVLTDPSGAIITWDTLDLTFEVEKTTWH